jgi:prophage maintenance system killer protein
LREIFTDEEIQEIIFDNSDRCTEKQEYHSVDNGLLLEIFQQVNACNSLTEVKRRIIRKAAYLISLIPNRQPFQECNRSTAVSATIDFLRANNLDLPLKNPTQISALRSIIDLAKKKNRDDPTLLSDVENYLVGNVIEYYRWY